MMIPGGYRVPPFAKGRLGGDFPAGVARFLGEIPPGPPFFKGGAQPIQVWSLSEITLRNLTTNMTLNSHRCLDGRMGLITENLEIFVPVIRQ